MYPFRLQDLLPGVVHASIVTAVGHPFDTVKTAYQANRFPTAVGNFDVARFILQQDGIRGFYRGGLPPLFSHLTKRPLQFPIYERLIERGHNPYLAGAIPAAFSTVIGAPLQNIKVNAQSRTTVDFGGPLKFAHRCWQRGGLPALYRGFGVTLCKDICFGGVFLGSYGLIRQGLRFESKPVQQSAGNLARAATAGASAHALTWLLLMPIDFVKTNVQRSDKPIGSFKVLSTAIRQGGPAQLWHGATAAVLRTIPVSGFAMVGYELTRHLLSHHRQFESS